MYASLVYIVVSSYSNGTGAKTISNKDKSRFIDKYRIFSTLKLNKHCSMKQLVEVDVASEARLRTLRDFGFILRIPGGSGRKGESSSYGLVPKYQDGKIYILVVPYNPKIVINRSYEEKEFGEEPEGILELRLGKQTGVVAQEYIKIGEQVANNNKEFVYNEKHIKNVFFVENYDDTNIRKKASPDSRLDPPVWVEIELLKQYIFPGHLWIIELFEKQILAPRMHER